jgi:serine protease Do
VIRRLTGALPRPARAVEKRGGGAILELATAPLIQVCSFFNVYPSLKVNFMQRAFLTGSFALALLAAAVTSQAQQLPDFTQLVEKSAPAVVNVEATQTDVGKGQGDIDDEDVPEIFKRFFGPGVRPHGGGGGERHSLGSGFIISSDGYVLTNNHVVDGADEIVIKLSDRRELDAKVIGTDKESDVALLKVNATSLPTVPLGDSSKLKPGQWVVAIGSPFGLDHSITQGIISYVGRSNGGGDQQYVPFIQTDVPINRGNSGGPLFDLEGKVVGINSQIFSNTGGYMGVSFAIPINVAMNTVEQLKSTGHVSRGMIGVGIQPVTREFARTLGLPNTSGALVLSVAPDSSASKADIHVQDVILAYNGHPIEQTSDLPLLVGNTKPGTKADLKVYRDGKTFEVPVTVGELPRDKNQVASLNSEDGKVRNRLGLSVEDLNAEQRKQLGIKDQGGVVISDITGAARRTALQPGDVVLMVNRKQVKSSKDFYDAVKDVKEGESAMLLVKRGDATQFVAISVPKGKDRG